MDHRMKERRGLAMSCVECVSLSGMLSIYLEYRARRRVGTYV